PPRRLAKAAALQHDQFHNAKSQRPDMPARRIDAPHRIALHIARQHPPPIPARTRSDLRQRITADAGEFAIALQFPPGAVMSGVNHPAFEQPFQPVHMHVPHTTCFALPALSHFATPSKLRISTRTPSVPPQASVSRFKTRESTAALSRAAIRS